MDLRVREGDDLGAPALGLDGRVADRDRTPSMTVLVCRRSPWWHGRWVSILSGRHYPREVILWAVRWYCRYGIAYRELGEILTKRGDTLDFYSPSGSGVRYRCGRD